MLVRELKRLLPFLGPLLVLLFLASRYYDSAVIPLPSFGSPPSTSSSSDPTKPENPEKVESPEKPAHKTGHPIAGYTEGSYHEIFSVSTTDKKYFKIIWDKKESINPNAIPHPTREDTWIIVSQLQRSEDVEISVWFAELVCNAVFKDGHLTCVEAPLILPISGTPVRTSLSPSAW
jgi:hypothetical protein